MLNQANMVNRLTVMSIQAANQDAFVQDVTAYLGDTMGVTAVFPIALPWQERERLFDAGEIQVGWICGLPYVWKADSGQPPVALLAAPIMAAPRYQNQPVYFSDVIVRTDSRFARFVDLRGARWVYNEPHSHSGYNLVAYHLAALGEDWSYFDEVQASGAHQASMEWVRNGRSDASAIDSTVLEIEFARDPELQKRFRIIDTLGPSPMPPWVIRGDAPPALSEKIRQTLLTMHQHRRGEAVLTRHGAARFTAVTDTDYDVIRHMVQVTGIRP